MGAYKKNKKEKENPLHSPGCQKPASQSQQQAQEQERKIKSTSSSVLKTLENRPL